jgi:glyoxylase-like metal-dependent hydrolase (beta-lactamase superfamily II)
MSVKAEAKPLAEPLSGGPEGTTVAVEPLLGAEMQVPKRLLESSGGRLALLRASGIGVPKSHWSWAPVPAYLIHHPQAGPILVDTALHPSVEAKPAANLGRAVAAATSFRMPNGDLPTQLRGRGVDPKSIETVVMTHLHVDHASGIAEFPNATFVLSEREWEAATTVGRPLLHGYRRAHFDYLFDYRTIDFDGPLIDSYATFGRTFDLFGDGSVRLALTPGHTDGHLSVVARLRQHDFVIAGDAVYTLDQLAGKNVPARPEDMHEWQRSRRELQRFSEGFPSAVIVPGHDPDAWAKLSPRYE